MWAVYFTCRTGGVFGGGGCMDSCALILESDFLSIPVRVHTSEVESRGEAKSIHSKTSG